jgi:two-component system chemotaxis sensor kinase CheA
MDRERMLKRLMATFLEELGENVAALNRDLLALEKASGTKERAEIIKVLFRTAHSLKGAARSASVGPIERACHALESTLDRAQKSQGVLTPEVFAVFFAAADALEEAGQRLREQQDLSDSPLNGLLPRLEAVAKGLPPPASASATPVVPLPKPPAVSDSPAEVAVSVTPAVVEKPPLSEEADLAEEIVSGPPAAGVLPTPSLGETGGSVRVAAEKLDTFLARSGALLVSRRRVQARSDDLINVREQLGRWKAEWQEVSKPLPAILRNDGEATPHWPQRLVQAVAQVGDNITRLEKELERLSAALVEDVRALKEAAVALDDEVRRVRMLPFAEACEGLDRMVRDLAQAGGKEVDLVLEGGDVELDRSVLQGLRDPLRHMVRNAVDHGVETPQQRWTAGKPSRAQIRVAAVLRGAQVEVVVSDDGRGLDLEALRHQVRKRKLPEPTDERELARVVFLPGLSTSRLITDVSGRGVGLDVVKSRVEALHGTIDLSFAQGRGTRFSLAVPLTLTTLRALLLTAGGQTFAFVDTNVQRLVRFSPEDLRFVEGREMLALGGPPLPVASLADTLGLKGSSPAREGGKMPAVLVAAGERRMAFVVDELLAEQEVVVKGLGPRIRNLRHISGATLLPSGGIALVLNAANLVRTALARAPAAGVAPLAGTAPSRKQRLLVVDDSVTTRTLEQSILEAAGYEVSVAPDGVMAWQLLQERGFDLVVSDVDMPRMDGFALTEAIRSSRQIPELPVVLVTARASEEDRGRGLAVGANAYLVKSSFDQSNLLETIAQLL